MLLSTLLWNNDGVLVDTEKLHFRATREAATLEGIQLTLKQFRELSLTAVRSMFDVLLERGVSRGRVEQIRLERNRVYRDYLSAGCKPWAEYAEHSPSWAQPAAWVLSPARCANT